MFLYSATKLPDMKMYSVVGPVSAAIGAPLGERIPREIVNVIKFRRSGGFFRTAAKGVVRERQEKRDFSLRKPTLFAGAKRERKNRLAPK